MLRDHFKNFKKAFLMVEILKTRRSGSNRGCNKEKSVPVSSAWWPPGHSKTYKSISCLKKKRNPEHFLNKLK